MLFFFLKDKEEREAGTDSHTTWNQDDPGNAETWLGLAI
jgi:hypothetical protein